MLKAILSRIVVDPIVAPEKTKGGLYLPNTSEARTIPEKGKVLSVGAGKPDEPMQISIGDVVLFAPHGGARIFVGEPGSQKEFIVLEQRDIYAIED